MHFWKKIQISIPDFSPVVQNGRLGLLRFLNPFALDIRSDEVINTAAISWFPVTY